MQKLYIPKIAFSLVRKVLLLSLLLSLTFSGGYFFGYKGFRASYQKFPKVTITREVPVDKKDIDFNLFLRVWDTLYAKYYDNTKLIPSELVYGAIKGMVSAVGDPYTVFLPPEENKVVQEDLQGSFEGVGIKDDRKSIERGTVGITIPEAVQIIRGPAGTKVTLVLLREGDTEPFEAEITREAINVPSVTVTYVGEAGRIAHAKILKFSGEPTKEWVEVVVELVQKDLDAIIVDVRNNPGGYLQAAVDLASDFLENGETVVKEESAGQIRNEYRVEKLGRLRKGEVVVLVNEGSASASEILAGALRDNKRAELIGS